MRIGFLSHFDMNLYLFRLPIMKRLISNGHKVYAITPCSEGCEKLRSEGIEVIEYKISRKSLNPLKELKTIHNIFKVVKPLDLDILHSFTAKPNIYGAVAGDLAKVPVIISTVTGLGSFYISKSKKATIVKNTMEKLYKSAFRKAHGVIFQNSDDLKYFVEKKIVKKEKTKLVVSSGVDTEFFSKESVDKEKLDLLREEINPEGKKVILMIARAIKHKGVVEYYKSAEILKEKGYLFLFVGGSDIGNPGSLDEKFLHSPYVKYLGERWDVREIIELCDLFVLPSYREGTPRTLLEAGAMKKAMITTDTVGCKEVVDNGYNGYLVPVENYEILSQKTEEILEDDTLRSKMAENAYQKTIDNFSSHTVVKKYMEYYENLSAHI
ncbi:MAG: glycosyltransferase family 4 protein [Campylobacterales bacterium]|nr:glycosyltransferase family 4 protein [Campylobacterales bacterium]